MAGIRSRSTPGVYVTEYDAFPPSVVGVQTAVPAFIGYTAQALIGGKSTFMKPVALTSLAEFEAIFGQGFEPTYEIVPASPTPPDAWDFMVGTDYYNLKPKTNTTFNLYYSMRLFFQNGGSNCYVVSVGDYEDAAGGVTATDLIDGLTAIRDQSGPTMLIIPDAVLLTDDDFSKVASQMLNQCGELQDRVAILDFWNDGTLTQANLSTDLATALEAYQKLIKSEYLSYGMSYFPFLNTSVVENTDINFTFFDSTGDLPLPKLLATEAALLYPGDSNKGTREAVQVMIDAIATTKTDKAITTLNQNLGNAIPPYKEWQAVIKRKLGVLPPSGGMAGIFTTTDNTRGVWNAPANIAMTAVVSCTLKLNDAQQGTLNMPLNGMAVDVIRDFRGRGPVVWGARTLDGNSNDWRYIQVRRAIVYMEQSIKNALNPYVFAPNTGQTWVTVTSMISNFLQVVWSQGGLMGDKASDAFTVQCGLGSTMTAQDVLDGYMIVQVTLQMIRPAEFIELTFKQQMQGA